MKCPWWEERCLVRLTGDSAKCSHTGEYTCIHSNSVHVYTLRTCLNLIFVIVYNIDDDPLVDVAIHLSMTEDFNVHGICDISSSS